MVMIKVYGNKNNDKSSINKSNRYHDSKDSSDWVWVVVMVMYRISIVI